MKKITYTFFTLLLFCILGCASTYNLKDFSSKQEFYEDFNESMYKTPVKVTLNNDSSFTTSESVKIVNDNLVIASPDKSSVNMLPIKSIKEIRTYNEVNPKLVGTLIGATFSFLLSFAILEANSSANNSHDTGSIVSPFPGSLIYGALGGLVGFGIGSLFDKTIIYQFNQ